MTLNRSKCQHFADEVICEIESPESGLMIYVMR